MRLQFFTTDEIEDYLYEDWGNVATQFEFGLNLFGLWTLSDIY